MKRRHRPRKRQQGSALLVTLMVVVGLSLLGLGFVSLSETESAISLNERNYSQTHAVAEAGARVVLEWFQDPEWADEHGILPDNDDAVKTERLVTTGVYAAQFPNRYKQDEEYLFDKPFKGASIHRFYGDEDHADVIINATTDATFLTTFNNTLFPNSDTRVTDIRVYAPPILNATVNADGFWEEGTTGQRYGVATIRVTAQKVVSSRVVAERWVKLVISEWPFPGPQGPVQSNANISTGGNFGVHWGRMTSERDMEIKRPLIGLPWFNAYESITFEWGYFEPGEDHKGNLLTADFEDQYNWNYKVLDVGFEDPWYQARAKREITNAIATANPHVFDLDAPNDDITDTTVAGGVYTGWTNWFQNQDHDEPPNGDYKLVLFPKIDYEFWKNISQSASTSNNNVHYLRYAGGGEFTDGVETKDFAHWVNCADSDDPAKPGFYFFDTVEGINPQAGAGGSLTPAISLTNADTDGADDFIMKGFVYLNAVSFGTTGIGGPGGWFNYPGEPYRDIGFTTSLGVPNFGAGDGKFTYEDLRDNDRVDIFVGPVQAVNRPDGTAISVRLPVPWSSGCVIGFNNETGANCSEPHEPFLNLVYPVEACCTGGGQPFALIPRWEEGVSAATLTRRSKKKDDDGNPIACAALTATDPPDKDCTSNGWDEDGPLVENFGGPNTEPILDGVLYNEGDFDAQGNAAYFGSILINGDISGTGTPEVWFDEYLVKGGWQDKFKELPRVYVTAHETDQ